MAKQPRKPTARSRRKPSSKKSTDAELQTLFQSLIENSFDVIHVIDTEGTTLYISPSSETLLGYTPDELIGATTLDFIHPDDSDKAREVVTTTAHNGERPSPTEIRAIRKDGVPRTFEVVARALPSPPFADGIVLNYHDVTEQKKVEDALRRSEQRFFRAYHSCPASVTISDLETGRFIEVNDGFQRLSGYRREDIIGKTAIELNIWKNAEERNAVVRMLMTGQDVRNYEVEFVVRDEDVRNCLVSARVIQLDKKRCMLAVVEDITERSRAEADLRQATESLHLEREELTEKNIALKQVLDHMEQDRTRYRHDLSARVENLLGPVLTRLKKGGGRLNPKEIQRFEEALWTIVEQDIDQFANNLAKLTARELDVCQFLKDGLSSKEIAASLSLSLQTVHKHRRSIRRKLQLANKDINLAAYLRTKPSTP